MPALGLWPRYRVGHMDRPIPGSNPRRADAVSVVRKGTHLSSRGRVFRGEEGSNPSTATSARRDAKGEGRQRATLKVQDARDTSGGISKKTNVSLFAAVLRINIVSIILESLPQMFYLPRQGGRCAIKRECQLRAAES